MTIPVNPDISGFDNVKTLFSENDITLLNRDQISDLSVLESMDIDISDPDTTVLPNTQVLVTLDDQSVYVKYRRLDLHTLYRIKVKDALVVNTDGEIIFNDTYTLESLKNNLETIMPFIDTDIAIEADILDDTATLNISAPNSLVYTGATEIHFKNQKWLWDIPSKYAISRKIQSAITLSHDRTQEVASLLTMEIEANDNTAILTDAKWGAIPGGDITSALSKALNDPNIYTIVIPSGEYSISSITLNQIQQKTIIGQGTVTLNYTKSSTAPAIFVIPSAGNVKNITFSNFILDGKWETGNHPANAFQITNADNITFYKVEIRNIGNAGILAQGYAPAGTGSKNLTVVECKLENIGLQDKTTGFGILVKDASTNAVITNNYLKNIVGGMGIAGNSTALGNATHALVVRNRIEMGPSTTEFEGIGFTKGCEYTLIAENVNIPSHDNGISASANHSIVVRNYVSSCYNHGIAIEGQYSVVSSNDVNLVGQQNVIKGETLEYGGITIENGSNNYLGYNTITGGDMAYAIKFNGTHNGNTYIGNNTITGYTKTYYSKETHATDVIDSVMPDLSYPLLSEEEKNTIGMTAGILSV